MPRVGDVFQLLSGTLAVPNTTIQSAPYNAQQNDWVLEANAPRPISAGGTGSTTAAGARTSLGAMGAGDLAASLTKAAVVNTDSVVIIDSEAANVTKRWLVSDIRTAFGPASHDHYKLVNIAADISFVAGGTPGAGVFYFMSNAEGTVANATITEAGAMSLVSVSTTTITATGTITAGTITATGNITAGGIITAGSNIIANGTVFHSPGATIISSNASNVYLRPYGQRTDISVATSQAYLRTDGVFIAPYLSASGSIGAGTHVEAQKYFAYAGRFVGLSSSGHCVLSGNGGTIFLRPNGEDDITPQYQFNSANAYKLGGGSWGSASDERVKTVNGDYTSGLDQILALQPVRFTYKNNGQPPDAAPLEPGTKEYIGLVAQQAEGPMPELVHQVEGYIDGEAVSDFRMLDNSPLVYAIVNSIKELNAKIRILEAPHDPTGTH